MPVDKTYLQLMIADDFEKMLGFLIAHFQRFGVERSRIRTELMKAAEQLADKPEDVGG